MSNFLTGVVRGNTIEFQGGLGLPDGKVVSVTLQPVRGTPPANSTTLSETFSSLAEEWKIATGHLSNIAQKPDIPPIRQSSS